MSRFSSVAFSVRNNPDEILCKSYFPYFKNREQEIINKYNNDYQGSSHVVINNEKYAVIVREKIYA